MQKLALPLVLVSLGLALMVVLIRRYWIDFDSLVVGLAVGAALLSVAVYCYARAKKHFESRREAFIRIESHSCLHSSLSAAEAGKTSWPVIPDKIDSGIRWHFTGLLSPIFGSLFLILASFTIPIQPLTPEMPTSAPKAWQNLTAELEELRDGKLVQSAYIEEIEKKLGELKNQPQKDWYSHPSLEATENLTKLFRSELGQLSNKLNRAEKSLAMLKQHGKDMKEAQRTRFLEQFNNAIEAMEKGRMKPNKNLLEQLKKIDPKMLNHLTPEQTQKLREQMRAMSDQLRQQLREGLQPGEQLPDDNGKEGGREALTNPEPGIRPNPELDSGHIPRVLGDEADELKQGQIKKLDAKDLTKSIPGDLLETTDGGEHEIDRSKTSQSEGGDVKNKGAGGDSVWKGNYLPKEKRALKNFFNSN